MNAVVNVATAVVLIFLELYLSTTLTLSCTLYAIAFVNWVMAAVTLGEITAERKMRKQGLK